MDGNARTQDKRRSYAEYLIDAAHGRVPPKPTPTAPDRVAGCGKRAAAGDLRGWLVAEESWPGLAERD